MRHHVIATQRDARRRTILLTATCSAIGTLIPVAAHQLGILDHLPDPPGKLFDSDRITTSKIAYPLGIPDSLLGLSSYCSTLALILLARNYPMTRRLLRLKLYADGSLAAFNTVRQITSFRRLCAWCTGTALCTAIMLYASRAGVMEVREMIPGDLNKTLPS